MTIYALSTGPGISGIAVIRVSGNRAAEVIKRVTSDKLPNQREATRRQFYYINTRELIDEGVLLWFPGPNSYTGEDMAEFHVHGSRAVINSLQKTISKIKGCRLADPGEFTKIALHLNLMTMNFNSIRTNMMFKSVNFHAK